jgi:hypothetical protein
VALALAALALPVSEQAQAAIGCRGTNPGWTLELREDSAYFSLPQPMEYEIPLITMADNREWPRVYTLLMGFETAIVILDKDLCQLGNRRFPMSVDVLTQRAETPIVLTGCCLDTPE